MIDLQGDEKIILQVRKSWATLVPQVLLLIVVGFAAYWVSYGFYQFRDNFLFTEASQKGVFHPSAGSWFANGMHQNILILLGLAFLAVATFIAAKVVKAQRAKKRTAAGLPPKTPKPPKDVMATPEAELKALLHRSSRRLTSYYRVERYIASVAMIIFIGFGIFGWNDVSPWYYVVVAVLPLTAYLFFRWYMTRYALTSKRLTISAGLISSFFWDLPFDKYDEISGDQNFVERILCFGDLTVNSVGGSREAIRHVPHPERMRKNFHAVREEYKQHIMARAIERAQETREREAAKEGETQPHNEPPGQMP